MTKECPSCGNVVEAGQLYCPACGAKLIMGTERKRTFNKELESQLIQADNYAEICLSKKLGAGPIGGMNYENLNKCENLYLHIIEMFPTESKAYIAYVDYMIKRTEKLANITNVFARTQYFIGDIDLIVKRCKQYLVKAKQFASDDDLEQILQMDSLVASKLEAIASDKTISDREAKNTKIAKIAWIFLGVFFGIISLCYLVAEIAGI